MARDDGSIPRRLADPAPNPRRGALVIVMLGFAALAAAATWVFVTATRQGSNAQIIDGKGLLTLDRPFPVLGRFRGDPYVGPKVCAECHPAEAALYSRSGHALTLRRAGRRVLSQRLDGMIVADPEQAGVRFSYHYRDQRLQISRAAAGQVEHWVVDYAFGSGHNATTFVNLTDSAIPRILEHRLTYYSRTDKLLVTPGQGAHRRSDENKPYGREPNPRDSLKCFRCHTTQVAAARRWADRH